MMNPNEQFNAMMDNMVKTMQTLNDQMKQFTESYVQNVFGSEATKKMMDQLAAMQEALAPFQKLNPLFDQYKKMQPDTQVFEDLKNIMTKFQDEQMKLFQASLEQLQQIAPTFVQMDQFSQAFEPFNKVFAPFMDQMKTMQNTFMDSFKK